MSSKVILFSDQLNGKTMPNMILFNNMLYKEILPYIWGGELNFKHFKGKWFS